MHLYLVYLTQTNLDLFLVLLNDFVSDSLARKHVTSMLLLDIKEVFDTIEYEIVLKMIQLWV